MPSVQFLDDAPASVPGVKSSGSVTFDDEPSSSEPKVTFDDAPKSNEDLRKEFEAQEAQSVWERAKALPGKALEGAKSAVEPLLQTPAEMGEASAQPDFGKRLLSTVTRGKVKAVRGLADFASGAVTHAAEEAYDHPVASVVKGLGAPFKLTADALNYLGLNPTGDKEARWKQFQEHYFRKLAEAENANAPATSLERAATTIMEPFSNIAEQVTGGEAESLPQSTEALSTVLQLAIPEAGLGATAKVGKAVDAGLQAARATKIAELAGKGAQAVGKGTKYAGELPEKLASSATKALLGEGAGDAVKKAADVAGLASMPGAAVSHIVDASLDPLGLGKLKALSKTGEGLQGVGEVAEAMATAPKDSIWGRAHAVATGEDAPGWMKTLLSQKLVKAGMEAGGIAKDVAKGAAGGAGIGLAYGGMTGQSPEEMAESLGGGAALGAGAHAVKIPGTSNRNILARTADASAALFKQHLADGVSPETLKSVPDSAWTMAAAIEQYPGLNAKVRFVSPETFANLKTTDGSPLTDPGAGGVWDRSRQTIWLNADSKRGVPLTLLHEAAHPIFDAAVMKQPEIGRAIEQGLAAKGQSIDDLKRTYVEALMSKELPSMDAPTREAAVQNRINAFDAAFPDNTWINSEALAENFVNSFGTKDVLHLDPTVASVMRNALKGIFGGKETTKGFFNEFENVVKSPELSKLSRGLLKSMRDHRPGLDVLGGEEKQVPLTPEMFGKRPEAPLHEITNTDGTVEKGNDFVVASPDGIKPRSFIAMRRIIKNRVAAVRSLFDTKTVLPLGSDVSTVALRRTRAGGEEISGTTLPTAFDGLSVYSKDTKNMAKLIQDAIDNGKTLGSWVHQVASGTLKKTWAAVARGTKGAFTAKYHDFQPYGWLVDKQGNVLVRVFDRQALSAKLADWANRKGITSLEQWGGDQGKAMKDITTYLENHAKGLKGEENGIGAEKANVINALLAGRNAEFADNNPMREHLKGGDRQGIVRSLRLDRIETMEPSQQADIPRPHYGKLVQNFSPEADSLTKMSPEDYTEFVSKFKGPHGGGQTGWSFDLGSRIKTADELNHLRELHGQMREQFKAAMAKGDYNNATTWASKSQAMREAYEAATNQTLDGKPSSTESFIQKLINPDFKSPMADKSPDGAATAIANSAAESVKANQQFSPDKKEKPHAVGGTIPVLHFSDSATPLKTVDPKFMRMNTVGKYWEPKPSRSFFFVQGSSLEEHNTKFANRDAYVANIDGRKIYDATGKDPLGFFETWPIAREKQIIAAGYKGVLISANGGKDKVIISYEPVKVKPSTEKTGTGSFSPDQTEHPTEAAIRLEDGQVFTGKWHKHATQAAEDAGVSQDKIEKADTGFVTNTGKFVNRLAASKLAVEAGLLGKEWIGQELDASVLSDSLGANEDGSFSPDTEEKPAFYSQLERTIADKFTGKQMPAAQLAAILRNPQNGVKVDELKWTGLDDYLKGKGKVTREEIQDYLKQNAVKVKEIVHTPANRILYTLKHRGGEEIGEYDSLSDASAEQQRQYEAGNQTFISQEAMGAQGKVKFQAYQLPGGENYREMLFQLPEKGLSTENFTSGHWDEPNVVAHTRINDRVDASGKPGLFIEEIQSDWHQKGRKNGYQGDKPPLPNRPESYQDLVVGDEIKGWGSIKEIRQTEAGPEFSLGKSWVRPKDFTLDKVVGRNERRIVTGDSVNQSKVPDAPFKTTWHELVFRRMVQEAAKQGKDWLGWTPGELQAERYDLSKQVDFVNYQKNADGTFNIRAEKNGQQIPIGTSIPLDKLPDYIGKDVAKTMEAGGGMALSGKNDGWNSLSGVDLKVGGEGMKGFYDKILVDYARKFGKKFGAEVKDRKLTTDNREPEWHTENEPALVSTVHSLDITPEMKKSVEGGVQLFSPDKAEYQEFLSKFKDMVLEINPDFDEAGLAEHYSDAKESVLQDLSKSRKIYRAVFSEFPDQERPGIFWTTDKAIAEGWSSRSTYGDTPSQPGQKRILERTLPKDYEHLVDWPGTVAARLTASESEIRLKNSSAQFSPDKAEKNSVDSKPGLSEDTGMLKKVSHYGKRITAILKDKEEKKPASLGVTFNVASGREVKNGFSASTFPEMSLPIEPKDFNQQVIANFLKEHIDVLKQPDTALGIWDDSKGDSKKIWLDIVTTTASKAFAEYLGKKYNQYGVGNLDEYVAGRDGFISTGGNGEAPKDMVPVSERLNADKKAFEDSIHELTIKGTVTPGVPESGPNGRMRSPEEADKLSLDHVLKSPDMDSYAKAIVDHFKTVAGFKDIKTKDTHAALKEISSRMQQNIEFWYRKASPEEREQWKQWYDIANKMSKDWGSDYGIDSHVVAAINAKFSPQTAWNNNVTLTRTFLETMKENPAVTEADKAALEAVMESRSKKKGARSPEENKKLTASVDAIKVGTKISELDDLQAGMVARIHNELKGELSTHDHNLEPVAEQDTGWNTDWPTLEGMVSIYRNPSRVNVSKWLGKNHKVRSFYNNHVAPESPNWTTVDTHAIAAALMLPVGSVDPEVRKGFGGIQHRGSGYKGTYFLYQDAYEKAAAKLGILPRELQSIVWEKARGALTRERKRALQADMSSVKQVHKLRESGRMTPEQVRDAVLDIYKENQPEEKSNEPESDEPF